jgi:O-antigen/teichoic acid export membrane protein
MTSTGQAIGRAPRLALTRTPARRFLLRGGLLVFVSTLAWHASNFAFNAVTARLLGPARYSELAATVALLYVATPLLVSIQTISSSTATELDVAGRLDGVRPLLAFHRRRLIVVGLVVTAVIGLASSAAARFLRIDSGLPIAIVGVGLSLSLLTHSQRGVLQGTKRFGRYSLSTFVEASVKVIGAAVFVIWIWPSVEGAVVAIPLAAACSLVTNSLLLRFLPPGKAERVARPIEGGRSGATVATFILLALLLAADVLAAKRYLVADAAGLYASISLAGKAVYFATSALALFLFPVFSEQRARSVDGRRAFAAAAGAIVLCSAALAAVYFTYPELVIRPLFGAHYANAAPYLGWIAIAFGCYAVAYLAATYLLARDSRVGVAILGCAAFAQLTSLFVFHSSIWQIVVVQVAVLGSAAAALVFVCLTAGASQPEAGGA